MSLIGSPQTEQVSFIQFFFLLFGGLLTGTFEIAGVVVHS
jgi:hypothetical protein